MRSMRLLLALSAFAAPASAQSPAPANKPISVVVSGGLTLPAGDLKDLSKTGFHYDVSVLIHPPSLPFVLRPELTFTRLSAKDLVSAYAATSGAYGSDATQMIGALGNIEVPLGGGLYVLAGGGVLNLKASTSGSGVTASSISQSKVTFDAGAGVRFKLGSIRGFAEGRLGTASYDEGKLGFSKAQFIPITFGLAF